VQLTIKRSKWLRGERAMRSYLHREPDQKKCCLGFLAEQCGIEVRLLANHHTLSEITPLMQELPSAMDFLLTKDRSTDSDVANELMTINDTPLGAKACVHKYNPAHHDFEVLSEELREGKLAQVFANHGLAAHFVD
jgi:hypothetical protein